MITKHITGISGKVTNSILNIKVVPDPALHVRGVYSPVHKNSKQQINGREYNPIHRVTETSGEVHIVESINPIDLQTNTKAANGTVTNKNGTVYAFRKLTDEELVAVKAALNI